MWKFCLSKGIDIKSNYFRSAKPRDFTQMKRLHHLFASYFDANRLFFRIIALSLHKIEQL